MKKIILLFVCAVCLAGCAIDEYPVVISRPDVIVTPYPGYYNIYYGPYYIPYRGYYYRSAPARPPYRPAPQKPVPPAGNPNYRTYNGHRR